MEQPPGPANPVDSTTSSFQLHRNLNLPPGYRFDPSDQQLLQLFLQPFVARKERKTCPIHEITDLYSSSPETLTRAYEHGGGGAWFFLATKKYRDVTSKANRVIEGEGGGDWVKKGPIRKVFENLTQLGVKRTQEFYAQGMDRAYWSMEEFYLTTGSNQVLAKICAIPFPGAKRPKSKSAESTPPAKKPKQDHPVDDTTPQARTDDGSVPPLTAQQTGTYDQSPAADEDFIYRPEHEQREWRKDTFLDPRDQ